MAITKLMHMKESPDWKPKHLWNAIRYILDPNKTDNGRLVGGNSGKKPKEVLDNFLETKEAFGKPDGRQGYHFVISFAKGETDEATAYEVIREFCEEYLGDDYDYVFAIHNDTAHKHGHIAPRKEGHAQDRQSAGGMQVSERQPHPKQGTESFISNKKEQGGTRRKSCCAS